VAAVSCLNVLQRVYCRGSAKSGGLLFADIEAVVKAMDDGALLQALAADGRLIKRPFLVTPAGPILTGFRQDEWEQALLNP
jgi:arsenate reductase-like glutaredoxin family protein